MKRSDFLKGILGGAVVASIPVKAQADEKEKEYQFDEIFIQPYNNEILFYPKQNCELYKTIKDLIGHERILEEKYFTCYLGFHDNLIPIKKTYTISDFMPFVLAAKGYYKKNKSFAEYDKGVFFRMIRERETDTMHFDVFLGDVRGQYYL